MGKLNLESFNDILFGALKDQSKEGKLKMIEAELSMIANMMFDEMAELMDELEKNGYESERFTKIKNIKNNTESLVLEAEKLRKELEKE